MENKYDVTIQTTYGSIVVTGVQAGNENEAFDKACELLAQEVMLFAKLAQIEKV